MSKQNALTEPVYYILLSLLTPMHGYGIMQNVKKLTNDRVNIGAGTLYSTERSTPCSQRALLRNTKAIRPKRNISSQMTEEAY